MKKTLEKLLRAVPDSYSDFVIALKAFCEGEKEITEKVIKFMQDNPDATTSDVGEYFDSIADLPEIEIVDGDE